MSILYLTLFLSLSCTLWRSGSHTLILSYSHTLMLSCSLALSLCCAHTLLLSHSLALMLSCSLTLSLSRCLLYALSLLISCSQSLYHFFLLLSCCLALSHSLSLSLLKWMCTQISSSQIRKAMGLFQPINSLVVIRNQWLIFQIKFDSFSILSSHIKINFYKSKDSKFALIFSLACF
jgi:hypothetical protein